MWKVIKDRGEIRDLRDTVSCMLEAASILLILEQNQVCEETWPWSLAETLYDLQHFRFYKEANKHN